MGILNIEMDDNLRKLLDSMEYENVCFIFSINKKEFFSCSCGCTGESDTMDSIIADSDDKLDSLVKRMFAKGRKSFPKCPGCGTTLVYELEDADDDIIAMRHTPVVEVDNDNFLAVSIETEGVGVNNYSVSYESYENEWKLVYDKKKGAFHEIDIDADEFPSCFKYEEYAAVNSKGDTFDMDRGLGSYYFCKFNYDIEYDNPYTFSVSGIIQTANLFSDVYGGISFLERCHVRDMEYLIDTLQIYADIRYLSDPEYDRLPAWAHVTSSSELKKAGINVKACTVEEAFGMSAEDICALDTEFGVTCISQLSTHKVLLEMKDPSVPEQVRILAERVPKKEWYIFSDICSLYGCSLETAVKHIMHSEMNYVSAYEGSKRIARYFSEMYEGKGLVEKGIWCSDIVNVNKPYSMKSGMMFECLKKTDMELEQYRRIAMKPTMDSFLKAIG